ncbi:MAG: choice-of-anchor D domain-containing protein [Bacteroidetes bacterium]|nr:choice-of-anchor D domain-containing protein [Bacteroidota bacterium]
MIELSLLFSTLLFAVTEMRAQQELPWREAHWRESFSSPPTVPYHLGTSTRIDTPAGYAILTPDRDSQTGRLFLPTMLPVDYFDVSFRAWFGGITASNGGGADGIVFIFAPLFDYPETGGGTLNFDGCLGYGVEFDTYHNTGLGDRSQEHVAVIKEYSSNHLISEVLATPTLKDEHWHTLRIRFRAGTVDVFIDGVQRLSTIISDFYPFDGFFGFSSATGFAFNEHRIDDIALSLPSRSSADFGIVNVCRPVIIDTTIDLRNNHPDGNTLLVESIRLENAIPGIFTLTDNPAPAQLAHGEVLHIPLRITVSTAGAWSAILHIDAANGERVYDTLRIISEEPMLEWDPGQFDFASTRVGEQAEFTASLRNTGRVPILLTGLQWDRQGSGVFSADMTLPLHLLPGNSTPVTIRFSPRAATMYHDSLLLLTECGNQAGIGVRGTGVLQDIVFSLQSPLLLTPDASGDLFIRLDSLPEYFNPAHISFSLTHDASYALIEDVSISGTALSENATLGNLVIGDQNVTFDLYEPDGIQDTGTVLAVRHRAMDPGADCQPVELAWGMSVPLPLDGSAGGEICINPSCRHPEGLRRMELPDMTVSPQPARALLHIRLTANTAGTAVVRLFDARGRSVRTVFDGILQAETRDLGVDVTDLACGYYHLVLMTPIGARHIPVVLEK